LLHLNLGGFVSFSTRTNFKTDPSALSTAHMTVHSDITNAVVRVLNVGTRVRVPSVRSCISAICRISV